MVIKNIDDYAGKMMVPIADPFFTTFKVYMVVGEKIYFPVHHYSPGNLLRKFHIGLPLHKISDKVADQKPFIVTSQ